MFAGTWGRSNFLRDADNVLHREQKSHGDASSAYESIPTPLSIHRILGAKAHPKMTWYLAESISFVFLLVLMFIIAAADTVSMHLSCSAGHGNTL